MNPRILLFPILLIIASLASCYPYPETPRKKESSKPQESVSGEEQQKIKEQRDKLKKEAAEKKRIAQENAPNDQEDATQPSERKTEPDSTTKPSPAPRREYPVAIPIPGKDGFVFSPYNNKPIDVRGIAKGTLVQDPTYPAAEKKNFRVP
ncbi:MAG: hypothetical protein EAZ42_03350 [Verrucomicrobia bacterium]|nr:MAG: hypothetical protein EAZ42_03350 [Verrucomicrobiota bacterium]